MWLKMITKRLIRTHLLALVLFGTVLVYINPAVEDIISNGVIPEGIGFSLEPSAVRITDNNGSTLLYIEIGEGVRVEYTYGKDGEQWEN